MYLSLRDVLSAIIHCMAKDMVVQLLVHNVFTEEEFTKQLEDIRQQQYYTLNPKFQDYLEKEWITCKAVSVWQINFIMHTCSFL